MSTEAGKTGEKILIFLTLLSLIFYPHCSGNRIERITGSAERMKNIRQSEEVPFFKLHMKNGDVYIFDDWKYSEKDSNISGKGNLLDYNRNNTSSGEFTIPLDSIVLAETNLISGSTGAGLLIAATIITGIFTIVCIANPKACFGSCPTFYASNGTELIVQAEGFSSSISPSLEETDIDALYRIKPDNRNFEIQLKNEAYETHVIKEANILALPSKEGSRVIASPDAKFYEVTNLMEASEISGEEGDCSEKLCTFDGFERFSPADSHNLAEKENYRNLIQ
jgi:hypothetical protein